MRRTHINNKPKGKKPAIVPPPQHKGPTLYPALFKCSCGCTSFVAGTWSGEPCWYCTRCSSPHDPGKFKPEPPKPFGVVIAEKDVGYGCGDNVTYRFETEKEAGIFEMGVRLGAMNDVRGRTNG